jgi:hypothetical protein
MNPLNARLAGFHCTAAIEASGICFSPLPIARRASIPSRLIVTVRPSNSTVPV